MSQSDVGGVLFANFNQDATSLAVGTHSGYSLYSLEAVETLRKIHEDTKVEDTSIIERLFSSSLIVLVSQQAPRKLRVYHFQKGNEICTQSYSNTILSVKMNRRHLIVCLEEKIFVHHIRDMKVVHTIRDTPPNVHGIMDLTTANDSESYLAYPGSIDDGRVNVFDATNLTALLTIHAHDSLLAALRFSNDAKKLATASTKGTVIRVFAIPSGERLFEFTRGLKRCVAICSLAFSKDSLYLCSSSNTETVHVYKLEKFDDQIQQRSSSDEGVGAWVGYFSKAASSYLPAQMNDLLLREKSFATARLPAVGTKNAVALPVIGGKLHLLVATTDGYLYCYQVESEGGECTLARQHKIGVQVEASILVGNESRASPMGTVEKGTAPGGESAAPRINDLDEFPPMSHCTD
uniref:WD repeat domain phosphoinositide-interacting protein 2 n=1 Tax=Parascaris univalens TaxID=6257 RepID=A0A915BE36_PARUN